MAEGKDNECVAVVVRCRPLNRKEKDESRSHIIDISLADRQVSIRNPDDANDTKSFTYDGAYDENTVQRNFYEESCFGIVESVLEGFNGTIFAYGQTGCGKSFTMQGPSATSLEMRGVIPNSFSHIFECVKAATDVQYLIRCSYLEIYNEEIKDLLGNQKNPNKCDIKEDPAKGVFIKGLTDVVVDSEEQLMAMLEKGISFRTVAATQMNAESSRSHSIFTVVVEMSSVDKDSGKEMLRAGKLNLVDLAGSERQKKTGATGALLKEGAKINLSLSALGNVISSLSEGAKGKHIPYRDSKLTRLLQDSLGGNTKTLMVAAISPADYNYDETMSTLRYANRAKNIKNKPKINEDPKDTMLREFKEEIERLRKMLADQAGLVEMAKAGGLPTAGVAGSAGGAGALLQPQGLSPTRRTTVAATDVLVDDEVDEDGGAAVPAPARASRPAAAGVGAAAVHDDDGSRVDRRALDELTQAVTEERDYVSEQLRLKESEIEQERRMREELMQRLAALQQHVVGDRDADHMRGAAAMPAIAGLHGGAAAAMGASGGNMLSEEEQREARREREEATKRLKERRLLAKKKRDEQQAAEMARVLQEKQAMEEELEELKNAAGAGGASPAGTMYSEEQVNEMVERRTAKLRKKYEKRITGLKADLQEVTDEFQYQRQMLADALAEQEKDGKLFETACRALLSDREMKKLVEKSKWMEEEEEWVIPPLKRSDRGGDSSAHLPDIGGGGGQHQGGGGRSGGGGSGYASLGHGSDGEAGSAGSSGSSLYPPIAQRGHGGAMPSSSGAGSGSSGQLASIRAPGGSQQGGYGPSTGHGHSSNAVHLPATSSSVALPSIGGPASNRSRNISPRFEPDERKAYDPDAMGPGASGQQRLGQHRSRPTSKHARPGSNTQFAALPQPSQQQQFLPQGQAYGHYHVEDGSDGVSDDPRLADKKKKKRRKKKSKSGGGGGAGASDEWGFLVADGDAADGEPEYSDDEDFEGASAMSNMSSARRGDDHNAHYLPDPNPNPGAGPERAKSRRGERERDRDRRADAAGGIGFDNAGDRDRDRDRAKSRRGERDRSNRGDRGGDSFESGGSGGFPVVSMSAMPPIDTRSGGAQGKASGGGSMLGSLPQIR